ncbi:MAG: 30S ribosomal protein S20 [Lentisphaerae bacterium]|jgi:small subunit ribosomal protein S20|nr:30S ribosomal protein S20 [Lentisphaerota bacterium]MBT4819519.1 30S ribosomal protein S20 [Lentisphaerota bacterium]MBT5610390.1 30S ribosomal protein S20 [Lentisphaerota bacterium]MBT7056218.1 30S ribosomal protein S20 [Lentisphaerota bacterium]MBT7841860.1 30S ribosomal protein S20 [Lentisphaerota bacterium]
MPNTKSAEKHLRTSDERRVANRVRKTRVKTYRRRLEAAIEEGNAEAAQALLPQCFSVLDRAAAKRTIHRNQAARTKKRLAARVAAMATAE